MIDTDEEKKFDTTQPFIAVVARYATSTRAPAGSSWRTMALSKENRNYRSA